MSQRRPYSERKSSRRSALDRFEGPLIAYVARILEDKFDRPIKAFPFTSELLRRLSRVADDPSFDGANIPDPDDVPIIGAALAGQVDVFFTGDKALLALEAIVAMRIAAPRAAWDLVFSA